MKMTTVEFEDLGQDFTTWEIENNKVFASLPFQTGIWKGSKVLNPDELKVGASIRIKTPHGDEITIKYPIKTMRVVDEVYGFDVEILLNGGGSKRQAVSRHWKMTSLAAVYRRALSVPRAVQILSVVALDQKAYTSAYGVGHSKFN